MTWESGNAAECVGRNTENKAAPRPDRWLRDKAEWTAATWERTDASAVTKTKSSSAREERGRKASFWSRSMGEGQFKDTSSWCPDGGLSFAPLEWSYVMIAAKVHFWLLTGCGPASLYTRALRRIKATTKSTLCAWNGQKSQRFGKVGVADSRSLCGAEKKKYLTITAYFWIS